MQTKKEPPVLHDFTTQNSTLHAKICHKRSRIVMDFDKQIQTTKVGQEKHYLD